MEKWKVLAEEDVSPSPWYVVKRHTVALPNGKVVDDYYVSVVPDIAMVLPITREGNVVLVRQYKHGIREVITELPGGMAKPGQSVEEAALAELEEETGIRTTIDNLEPLGKLANSSTKSNSMTQCFLARGLTFNSRQSLDDTEDIEILLRSPEEAIRMVMEGEIWVSDSAGFLLKWWLAKGSGLSFGSPV